MEFDCAFRLQSSVSPRVYNLFLHAHSVPIADIELHGARALRVGGELLVQLLDKHGVGVRLVGVDDGAAPEGVVEGDGAPLPEKLQNPLVVVPVIGL